MSFLGNGLVRPSVVAAQRYRTASLTSRRCNGISDLSGEDFILKLPKAEQNLKESQAATQALIIAAEYCGPLMHARIGVMRALNRHVERVFNPNRKDTHWGKRKLARDR